MKDYMLTVMAQDRVGIVGDVSSALAGIGGNIVRLSQTVVRGYFTLIISVEVPTECAELTVRQAVERSGGVGELCVNVRPYDEAPPLTSGETDLFTLSIQGTDRKGIIARTTCYLAERTINIEDFYSYVHEGKLLILAQVCVPADINVEEVQRGLAEVAREFDLVVHFQHADIFRVTSDVRPVIDFRSYNPVPTQHLKETE